MRYVKIVLIPESGGLHPAEERLRDDPDVQEDAILHLNLLDDGTAVSLATHHGDSDRLREILSGSDDVLDFEVLDRDNGIQTYIHFTPNETTEALLRLTREYEFVIDTPIRWDADDSGAVRVGLIGDDDTVQRAIESVPDNIRLELEQLSEYSPESQELSALLTERQKEILDTAVDVGYYEVPRRATHEDIADTLDLSTTTVGEHLRKIEARMLSEIARSP
ncbi:bacterio-opsin activator [Halobacteriales archaeon QS_4_70_19]|nr:MAG: bacterio-opsin activator [Halobacteriales archaeon QS_4_70_19]